MPASQYDLVVVGAGSGGIGAALAGARLGLHVALVEKAEGLGGTAVRGGVSVWEMGVGGTGIPFDIYRRLKQIPKAVGVYSIGRHCLWPSPAEKHPFPGGESVIDARLTYLDSLQRHGAKSMAVDEAFVRKHWHGIVFEPEAYAETVTEMLSETGNCDVRLGCESADVRCSDGRIEGIVTTAGDVINGRVFVDATGDARVARAAGCSVLLGQDSRDDFGEPEAPAARTDHLNGATLVYRVAPSAIFGVGELPPGIPAACWWRPDFPSASVVQYPCGDLNINALPLMDGNEAQGLGEDAARGECRRRVRAHWHHLQRIHRDFRGYVLASIAPSLGIRESYRVVCRHMLTCDDVRGGLNNRVHPDVVTIADHALDTHGSSTGRARCGELSQPYGVPLRSILAAGVVNLLVSSRCGGFTSLAASSCRLSRTVMQLGQAAGSAAAIAVGDRVPVAAVPPDALRHSLRRQHVQLEWPLSDDLREHLQNE